MGAGRPASREKGVVGILGGQLLEPLVWEVEVCGSVSPSPPDKLGIAIAASTGAAPT